MDSEKNEAEIQNPESESAPGSASSCQRLKFDENAGMDSEKNQAEIQNPESESAPGSPSSCQRQKFDENAGFVANMQNRFSEFIHAPMDEHKACFKETFLKVIDSLDDWNCNDSLRDLKAFSLFRRKIRCGLNEADGQENRKLLAMLYCLRCES